MKATLIKANGDEEEFEIPNPKSCLDLLYEKVGDNTIDIVSVTGDDGLRSMVVDDLGHMKRLPLNEKATRIYNDGRSVGTAPIVGDVVVTEKQLP